MLKGKEVGNVGEAVVLAKFVKMGIDVYQPFGDNTKADCIADFNNQLQRIQVKTCARLYNDSTYHIDLTSTHRKGKETYRVGYNSKDIDFFACYCLQRPEPILIPIILCENKNSVIIRIKPQKKVGGTNPPIYESDFLFENIVENYTNFPELTLSEEKKNSSNNFCADCGKPILETSVRCMQCEIKHRQKEKEQNFPLTRQQLKDKIRTQSFTSIGVELQMTDNNVRKWCKHFQLPHTKKDINAYSDEEWALI